MSGRIELLPFQVRASQQIVRRYLKLVEDPHRPTFTRTRPVPFYQALSALTGAGKTPILADAVSQIRTTMLIQPIVLWISKAKAVVDQTFANMEPGGKYNHLIDPFTVSYLSDITPDAIADGGTACCALATVGTFNQKDKSGGTLNVHKTKEDSDDVPLWTALATRKTHNGLRRPLLIVYDEGHNLSDGQTDLLLELEPDAILVASATMRIPSKLGVLVQRLKQDGWSDIPEDDTQEQVRSCLVTAVNSRAVVKEGLVKRRVVLGGYTSIMETMIDDMLAEMTIVAKKSKACQAGFAPKAIYVCRTNINQDDGSADIISRPFAERRAPPILIWRYLVEQKVVKASEIAVYCDLKVDRTNHPLPEDFKLFSGGEQDFAVFAAGDYRHVIFNLALQEGWDDPACAFAYIDKSMGSGVQVEQVIGRVLRQPGAKHFPDPDLNTANFYIRVDNKQEFPRILKAVQAKLGAEFPEVNVEGYNDARAKQKARQEPKKVLHVPHIHIESSEAVEPLAASLNGLIDFRRNPEATVGPGELVRAEQAIGEGTRGLIETLETAHSNRVTARWIVRREMMSQHPEAAKAIDWSRGAFDAKVEITSSAASVLRAAGDELVDIFLEHSELMFEDENLYSTGAVPVNPAKAVSFTNALHSSYDLNGLEREIAEAIDETGLNWARNPDNGGFAIPLLDKGDTRNFFPDFLVWKDDLVFAIDPKGGHLLAKDAWRKLLNITDERGSRKVLVRLISTGKWNDQIKEIGVKGAGFTVWSAFKSTGKLRARYAATVTEAVNVALRPV